MQKPKHPCSHAGCRTLIASGSKCSEHRRTHASKHSELYTTTKYRAGAKAFLEAHPWCSDPLGRHRDDRLNPGRPVPADTLGHRQAHKGNLALFWSPSNWMPLCKPCNSAMCVQREGGFGNPIPGVGGSESIVQRIYREAEEKRKKGE